MKLVYAKSVMEMKRFRSKAVQMSLAKQAKQMAAERAREKATVV